MTIKDAVANSLLMFVAASCVVLIVRALPQTSPRVEAGSTASVGSGEPTSAKTDLQSGVKVYYLHGNFRCTTCRTIEAYAREAVESGFGDELKAGKLLWQVVNYESPGNEHFAKDYEIVAPNVVLVKLDSGKQIAWKALPEVWELYRNKAAFVNSVQASLREFVTGVPAKPNSKPADNSPPALSPEPLPIPE